MILPEIVERVKRWLPSSAPISIANEMKSAGTITFDPTNVEWYARHGFPEIYSILAGGAPSWSGETVTVSSALNLSTAFCCKRVICESVGFLPLSMMQRKGAAKIDADWHPMYNGLRNAPNDEITAQTLREMMTGHVLMSGDSFAKINRRSGTGVAMELDKLMPSQVRPDREKTGQRRLIYLVKDGNAAEKTYTVEKNKPQDILHIRGLGWDGMRGYSVITMARQSVGTVQSTERNLARFFANGGRLPYNLKLAQNWKNKEDGEKFRADWEEIYSDPHRAPILEPWMEYQATGLSMADAQLLETRIFNVAEICRWFRVSPHLVGELSKATFSNIEQLGLEFVNFTLHPWLKRWEQELWRCLLTPDEKSEGYFFRHNVNALLRGDFQTRMMGYSTALQNGFMNQNEVRDLEDLNGFEGGDDYHIQLNMQTLPTQPQPAATQQQPGGLVRLNTGKKMRRVA